MSSVLVATTTCHKYVTIGSFLLWFFLSFSMAPLSSNLKSLHIFQPCLQIPQPPQIFANPLHLQHHKTREVKTFACQTNPNLHQSSSTEKSSAELDNRKGKGPPKVGPPKFPSKDIKKKIAMVSFLGALGLLLSSRLHFFDGKNMTLNDHCAHALPSQEARPNGKPTAMWGELDPDM